MRGFRHWRWHLDEMYVKLNGEMVYPGGRSTKKATGALHPVIESSSPYGLLVGVSSGGRFRLPTGGLSEIPCVGGRLNITPPWP